MTARIPKTLPTGCVWPACPCTRTHCDQRPEPPQEAAEPVPAVAVQDVTA